MTNHATTEAAKKEKAPVGGITNGGFNTHCTTEACKLKRLD
jgi:hypothetical protein